ncbi:MAG TPA: sigma-54 dependent transcriptional regulator [Spirochaetia bacterium]
MKRILVVDDEPNVRTVLTMLLEEDGYEVLTAENGDRGRVLFDKGPGFDLVITDLKMAGLDGLALLKHVRASGRDVPLVMITAYGTIEKAVETMKHGAADFITKPFNKDVIRHVVHKLMDRSDPLRQGAALPPLVAASPGMREIMATVEKIATAPSAVLILGESGCGKEVVARAIHARSVGRGRSETTVPFVSINCPAVPDTLIESELFGYRKGAFTGASQSFSGKLAQAHGGVLFLDEIAEIPLSTQAKLLRFIEEKAFEPLGSTTRTRVEARIVCATNRDLGTLVREGKFREDLYYRINTITLRVPPLRERREDVLPLAAHFLEHYANALGKPVTGFSEEASNALSRHAWPGNVRELRNVVERAVVLSSEELITADLFPVEVSGRQVMETSPTGTNKLEEMEKAALLEVMQKTGGNVSSAARELGISRDTLRYRIRKYGITAG